MNSPDSSQQAVETIREVEEDITVDSTFIRFSCEAVEDSLSMLLAEDCDVAVWAVGRLDVDMELPALTISWGTAAAIATAPWNSFIGLKNNHHQVFRDQVYMIFILTDFLGYVLEKTSNHPLIEVFLRSNLKQEYNRNWAEI